MAYLFRLILLCIPLLGAVAASDEAQRIDRSHVDVHANTTQSEVDIVLALNTASTIIPAITATDGVLTDQLDSTQSIARSAGAGLPICLALVLLVALVRQRAA